MINALKNIFNNAQPIGFYFHYIRAIRKKAGKLGLLSGCFKEKFKEILKELYTAPFYYSKDKNKLNSLHERNIIVNNKFKEFLEYYKTQWYQFFENGMLDYSSISK